MIHTVTHVAVWGSTDVGGSDGGAARMEYSERTLVTPTPGIHDLAWQYRC